MRNIRMEDITFTMLLLNMFTLLITVLIPKKCNISKYGQKKSMFKTFFLCKPGICVQYELGGKKK